jgi:hypothetical protein
MLAILTWIIDRLKERSSWLGLTALLSAVGVVLSPEAIDSIATAGLGVAGLIAFFTKDKIPAPAP